MKNKIFDIIIFLSSAISLIVKCATFFNVGIFVDEYNLSPDIILGSETLLYLQWLTLLLLFIICLLSLSKLIKK